MSADEAKPPQTALERIATWVHADVLRHLPDDARATAQLAFTDTLAVTLLGSRRAGPRMVAALERSFDAHATLIGMRERASVARAALVNGTSAHADLFDDNNAPMIAHPSAPLVSALLPLAQRAASSGHELVDAYCVGFEVGVSLGRALNPRLYEAGWHVSRTLGVIGTTAACCRLLKLTPRATVNALGIATSAAGGLRQHFGTMTMALHAGWTARDAVEAAALAAQGFDSDAGGLDGRYGLAQVFARSSIDDAFLAERFAVTSEPRFELTGSGIIFKPYPCGAPTHAAVDAALALHANEAVTANDIARIVCRAHPWNGMTLRDESPRTPNQARVSLRFCVAAALRFGQLSPDQFSDEALADAAVHRLMQAVEITVDPSLPDNGEFPAEVEIVLRDGRVLTERRDIPPGGTGRRLGRSEIETKFRQCAQGVLSESCCDAALKALARLDSLTDVRKLAALLEGDGPLARIPDARMPDARMPPFESDSKETR